MRMLTRLWTSSRGWKKMFNERIMVRIENNAENAVALAAAWGIIEHRPFAKYRVTQHFTTFWLTAKEKKAFDNIVKVAEGY